MIFKMASNNKESFAIKLSIYGSIIMAITGILASILGNSISLLFDALNTLIAIIHFYSRIAYFKIIKNKVQFKI
jgi:divalent metal cation (Fe/Co/Zn/Cd) transporter